MDHQWNGLVNRKTVHPRGGVQYEVIMIIMWKLSYENPKIFKIWLPLAMTIIMNGGWKLPEAQEQYALILPSSTNHSKTPFMEYGKVTNDMSKGKFIYNNKYNEDVCTNIRTLKTKTLMLVGEYANAYERR